MTIQEKQSKEPIGRIDFPHVCTDHSLHSVHGSNKNISQLSKLSTNVFFNCLIPEFLFLLFSCQSTIVSTFKISELILQEILAGQYL